MKTAFPPPSRKSKRSEFWTEAVAYAKSSKDDAESKGWVLVGNFSPGVATGIRRGNYRAFLPEDVSDPIAYMDAHWDITTRKTSDGKRNDIYIRWIG